MHNPRKNTLFEPNLDGGDFGYLTEEEDFDSDLAGYNETDYQSNLETNQSPRTAESSYKSAQSFEPQELGLRL